jgi:cyclopropane fatty-acyl-phospholipid synthase-like methyltransferase
LLAQNQEESFNEPEEYYKMESWKVFAQSQLPFLPTPFEAIETIFSFLNDKGVLNPNMLLIDLGAGDGRVIIYASETFGIRAVGVEVNLGMIESALKIIKQKNLEHICKMVEGDLYDFEVSEANLIFSFALPTNHRYFEKIIRNVKQGAYFISVRHDLDQFGAYWSEKHEITIPKLDYFKSFVYKRNDKK